MNEQKFTLLFSLLLLIYFKKILFMDSQKTTIYLYHIPILKYHLRK